MSFSFLYQIRLKDIDLVFFLYTYYHIVYTYITVTFWSINDEKDYFTCFKFFIKDEFLI